MSTTLSSYRLYVSFDRCTLVRLWNSGRVEVCERESENHIWGPPMVLVEEPTE